MLDGFAVGSTLFLCRFHYPFESKRAMQVSEALSVEVNWLKGAASNGSEEYEHRHVSFHWKVLGKG